MNIYLMRHFKVAFTWNKTYTSKDFKVACQQYDNATIINQNTSLNDTNYIVYTSNLIRSHLTYVALNINNKMEKNEHIHEVPIAPFIDTSFKLPTFLWMLMGRLQWYINSKRQPETKKETYFRIEKLITQLKNSKDDILIIGHGFYFSQLKKVLKQNNYLGNSKSYYKNGEIITFHKKIS